MVKKYLSSLFVAASIVISITACNNSVPGGTSSSPLTELWRVKGQAGEYINPKFIYDTASNLIWQVSHFNADGNEIDSLIKLNGSGQVQWSVTTSAQGILKNDNNNNIYFFYADRNTGKYNVAKYSPAGEILWHIPDIETAYSISVANANPDPDAHPLSAIDQSGNLFIPGRVGDGGCIIKIDPDGATVWRQDFAEFPFSLITDSLGNVYVGCSTLNASIKYDIRILKFDGVTGSVLWDKLCISNVTQYEANFNMVLDKTDNLLIVRGDTSASIDKFDPSGNHVWGYEYKPSDIGIHVDVQPIAKCDNNGNIIISAVVSVLTGSIPYGTFPLPLGYDYCQLILLDKNGTKTWSKKVSTILIYNGDMGGQLNIDKNNNIYVFCTDNLLIKYDTSGKKIWSYTPEITNVVQGHISEWHVDSELNLEWIVEGDGVQMEEPFRITKFKQN